MSYGEGGGGFIQESSSQQYGSSGSASKSKRGDKGIHPVTIKQLLNATQEAQDDAYMVDGRECTQVTVVGLITNVQEQSTCITYDLEDNTGQIQARMWLETDESDFMVRSRREWTPGTYVRAVGNMKSNQGSDTKALTAFHLRKVKDFNEVTYHLLDCCHAHLYNTKGALPDAKPMAPSNSSFASPQRAFAPQPAQPSSSGAVPMSGVTNNGGDGPVNIKDTLLEILKNASESPMGIGIDEAMAQLASKGARPCEKREVRGIIEDLAMEGLVYSTVDEDHFAATS